jgi:small-conductance mechanosensitive channel
MDAIRTTWKLLETVLGDERTQANLAAIGLGMSCVAIVWLIAHRALAGISDIPSDGTPLRPYAKTLRFVGRAIRRILGWACGLALMVMLGGGLAYHLTGGDVLQELVAAYRKLTPRGVAEGLVRMAVALGALAGGRWLLGGLRHRRAALRRAAFRRFRSGSSPLRRTLPLKTEAPRLREWSQLTRAIEWGAVCGVMFGAAWTALIASGLASTGPGLHSATVLASAAALAGILLGTRVASLVFALVSTPLARWLARACVRTRFAGFGDRIVGLVPFTRRCFDIAAWILAATVASTLSEWTQPLVAHGLRVAQAVGIFFAARVLVEVSGAMLVDGFASDGDRPRASQQGRTLAPLLQSVSQYAIYFCAGVLILDLFGQNPTPVLATMGVVGLAAGLGAQSLVNDLVSGFFILFEGQYLVGDYVQIGNAKGTVEAVAVRHTRIRDDQGKLYIIPNGTVKEVVNYSKGYVNAIVELKVPAGEDVEGVLKAMTQAGRELRETRPEVLGETVIHGVVDLNLTDTTVRAVTKVRPGTHGIVQNEFRRLLRERLRQSPPRDADGADSRAA